MTFDPLLTTRLVTGLAKAVIYAAMALAFLRAYRRPGPNRAICLALVINFATGTVMTLARLLTMFTKDDTYVVYAEISAALVTAVAARSILISVWK